MSPEPEHTIGKIAVFAIKVACGVIILICATFTLFTVGPAVETQFFPAVSKLRILSVSSTDMRESRVEAEFTKLRGCEYLGIAWFRGDPSGKFERVPVVLMRKDGDTSSPNRPTGTQKAGPWIIGVPPNEIGRNSFARLSHRCHPFWVTTTDFYP